MIIKKAEIEAVAVGPSQYPTGDFPEVALAGRSNVGKSSLINKMVNRKALARTSSTPGKTRTINFYNVNDMIYLVDLPGYGYAKVSKEEKSKWGNIIEEYLNERESLRFVILLVDSRHEPTKDDVMMFQWIKASKKRVVVVATKADKLTKNQLSKNMYVIKKTLSMREDDMLVFFSAQTGTGRDELWSIIKSLI